MITQKDRDNAPAVIARLTVLNDEATARIAQYIVDGENRSRIRNARDGVMLREEKIAELAVGV